MVALESCHGRRLKERQAVPEPSESVAPCRCHMRLEEAKGVGYKTHETKDYSRPDSLRCMWSTRSLLAAVTTVTSTVTQNETGKTNGGKPNSV